MGSSLVSLSLCRDILLILGNLCIVHSFKTSLYMITTPTLDDYSPTHSTWTLTTDSSYMCMHACSLNPDCVSAFYHPVEKTCEMTDTKYKDISQLQPHTGMKHYGTLPTMCSDIAFPQTASSCEKQIDPDGRAEQFGPSTVWCDLDAEPGTAITVINHDHEVRTFVDGYEDCGSYAINLTYDVGLEIARKIVDISTACKQYIKWECYDVKMFSNGDITRPCIRWKNRQMEDSGYLTGSGPGFDYCDCGQTLSCSYLGGCNCSENDLQWRYDEDYITNKQDLPITGFTAGDTGSFIGPVSGKLHDERGYHTIGPVLCY